MATETETKETLQSNGEKSELPEKATPPGVEAPDRAFVEHFESHDEAWREEHSKKLLRKIDLHLLPFLIIMYLLNFLDRSNLAQARQGTLEKDLGMSGSTSSGAHYLSFKSVSRVSCL